MATVEGHAGGGIPKLHRPTRAIHSRRLCRPIGITVSLTLLFCCWPHWEV